MDLCFAFRHASMYVDLSCPRIKIYGEYGIISVKYTSFDRKFFKIPGRRSGNNSFVIGHDL